MIERAAELKKAFISTFSTPDGKRVLEWLRQEFDKPDLHIPDNPHMTYYNLGSRDVIVCINETIRQQDE